MRTRCKFQKSNLHSISFPEPAGVSVSGHHTIPGADQKERSLWEGDWLVLWSEGPYILKN